MNDFIKFYREKENLWDCSLDVAEWFSKIHPLQERKNLIINILIEKINAFDNKEHITSIGLRGPMGIYNNSEYYNRVLYEIVKHIKFIRNHGFSLKYATYLAVNSLCEYNYNQNQYISAVIFEALAANLSD